MGISFIFQIWQQTQSPSVYWYNKVSEAYYDREHVLKVEFKINILNKISKIVISRTSDPMS